MKNTISVLNILAAFMPGQVAASLWITHSDTWKVTLPILLLAVTARNYIKDSND